MMRCRALKRGKNKIYIIDDGTNSVAHLGDLGCELTKEQINELENLDCIMVPVGDITRLMETSCRFDASTKSENGHSNALSR